MTHSGTTMRYLITRHGLSEHNLKTELFMGRSPWAGLVEEGRAQAHALGRRLAAAPARSTGSTPAAATRPNVIVCSSLRRTVETAQIVAEHLGGPHGRTPQLIEDDALWELSKGDWEGKMPRALAPEIAAAVAADPFGYRYPNGESYRDVVARTVPALEAHLAQHAGQRVLFVVHGDVIRALLQGLLDLPQPRIGDFATAPCALTELERQDGRDRLLRFNDTAHLEG